MNESIVKKKNDPFLKRIHEVDFARGLLIILVVVDHLMWNFYYYSPMWLGADSWLARASDFYFFSAARSVIQPIALASFCFISGISCAFSKNNKKRAWLTIGLAAFLALVTNIAQLIIKDSAEIRIDINIIGVLGLSTLVYTFIEKRSWKALLAAILIAYLISSYLHPNLRMNLVHYLGGITSDRPGVSFGEGMTPNFYMPLFWENPHTADFVPLFPYIMFFLIGTIVSYFIYKEKRQSVIPHRGDWERPICFLGRHTLIIYLAHFIILRGIFMIINIIITGGIA